MAAAGGIQLNFERKLDAPVAHVYKVLTGTEFISRWFGPSDEFKVTVHQWDARIGGSYRVEFNTPAGETHIVIGTFKELVPNQKVAYTWTWEGRPAMDSLVTFTIRADGNKTLLTLVHGGFPAEEVRDHHQQGWAGSMERLSRAVT